MKPDTPTPAYVDIRQLHVTFTGGKKPVQAVSGVDLRVQRGEVEIMDLAGLRRTYA